MRRMTFALLLLVLLGLFSGCSSQPDVLPQTPEPTLAVPVYSVLGTWEYTLVEKATGNAYDSGTLTFTGTESEGKYRMLNFYEVEYLGTYVVNGLEVILGMENFAMTGGFTGVDTISGTWENPADEVEGTFEMTRK